MNLNIKAHSFLFHFPQIEVCTSHKGEGGDCKIISKISDSSDMNCMKEK